MNLFFQKNCFNYRKKKKVEGLALVLYNLFWSRFGCLRRCWKSFLPLQLCFVVHRGVGLPAGGFSGSLVVVGELAFGSVLLFAACLGGGCWLPVMEEFVALTDSSFLQI
jgi:hypothetical protein